MGPIEKIRCSHDLQAVMERRRGKPFGNTGRIAEGAQEQDVGCHIGGRVPAARRQKVSDGRVASSGVRMIAGIEYHVSAEEIG